jgi:hypothetical protein
MRLNVESFVQTNPCDSIAAEAFPTDVTEIGGTYTGMYGQDVKFRLPGKDDWVIKIKDDIPVFSRVMEEAHKFRLEFKIAGPKAVPSREQGKVYLTDRFFIKTSRGKYLQKKVDDLHFTLTDNKDTAATFYLFQKHSKSTNLEGGAGEVFAEKNDKDDDLRYLHAIVPTKRGRYDDLDHIGVQWKTGNENYLRLVVDSQSQWETFTYTLF